MPDMDSQEWRGYAVALEDAAASLEAFTRPLAAAAGEFEGFAEREGVLGPGSLRDAHGKLLRGLRDQAQQAMLKAEASS